jgi:uncharacterized protein YjbI with pentapeptide repeats
LFLDYHWDVLPVWLSYALLLVAANSLDAVVVMLNSGSRKRITVTASIKGIERAEKALVRKGVVSKEEFAKSILMGKSTVDKFFTRKAIQLDSFQRICEGLTIADWRSIAELEDIVEQLPPENIKEEGVAEKSAMLAHVGVQSAGLSIIAMDNQSGEIKARIDLDTNISNFNFQTKMSLEALLKFYGGATIKIVKTEPGSVKVKIKGTKKDIAKLLDCINSGEIATLVGFSIQDTQILSPEFLEELGTTSNQKKWDLVREIITNPSIRGDLSNQDLSSVDLSGKILSGKILRNSDLSGADLGGADLKNGILYNTNLSNANLRDTNLYIANLSYANLSYANLSYANLSYANLSNANLSYANLSYADLRGIILNNVNLNSVDLSGADLSGTDLNGADLSSKNLSDTGFRYANLSNADLKGSNLSNADLRGSNLSYANFENAIVQNCYLGEGNGLAELAKNDLTQRGAIFGEVSGDRSSVLAQR